MAATRRRAKKNHLGPTAASPIMVRPPSPIDENQDTHHRHKKHLKRRVILHVASRRFVGSYEVEFCPTCPPHQIKESLQLFRAADTGSFSRNTFLTFRGMNRDTTVNSYDPDSPREMAQLIKLIEKRHQEGGKINLRIARKGLAVRSSRVPV